MSGKGKPFGRDKKVPAKPKADNPPKVENPPAQPALGDDTTTLIPQEGDVIVKPSKEAEMVLTALVLTNEAAWTAAGVPRASPLLLQRFAADIVRRFPGLTRKPGVPRHAREDRQMAKRGRLPDGSIFLAVWDAADGVWYGKLVTAPATGLGGMLAQMIAAGGHFAASHTGVFGLLKRLDTMYRELLGRQKGGGK